MIREFSFKDPFPKDITILTTSVDLPHREIAEFCKDSLQESFKGRYTSYFDTKLNTHKLMLDYDDGEMVPGLYHSSSAFGLIDTITGGEWGIDGFISHNTNDRVPDFVYKMTEDGVNNSGWSKSRFFTVGATGSDEIRVGNSVQLLRDSVDTDSGFLEIYYNNSGSANDYAESYRSYQIVVPYIIVMLVIINVEHCSNGQLKQKWVNLELLIYHILYMEIVIGMNFLKNTFINFQQITQQATEIHRVGLFKEPKYDCRIIHMQM